MTAAVAHGEGLSLPCTRCGGRFAIAKLAAAVRCPYCGEPHDIDPQLRAELAAYRDGVDNHVAAADEELQHVAAWAATEQSISGRAMWLPFAIFFGVPLFASLAFIVIDKAGLATAELMPMLNVGMVVLVNAVALGWVGWSFVKRARMRGEKTQLRGGTVACPGCGAANPIAAGQTLTQCGHCGGALVPGKTLIGANLDAARQAERTARVERHRAERRGTLKLMKYSQSARWIPLISGAPVVIGLLGGLGYATTQMLRGQLPWDPVIMLGWAVVATMLGVAGVWRLVRVRRQDALDRATADLLTQLGPHARELDGLEPAVAWLDTYWPDTYETRHLHAGPYFRALSGHVHGYPVLIDFNPTATDKYRKPRLHLLVASTPQVEVDDASRARANTLERAAEHEGFDVRSNDAGVWAMASRKIIKQLFKEPDATHALIAELNRLTHIAAARGRVPSPPIP